MYPVRSLASFRIPLWSVSSRASEPPQDDRFCYYISTAQMEDGYMTVKLSTNLDISLAELVDGNLEFTIVRLPAD